MTTLDYSPLTSPVSRQEVAQFRRESAGSIVASSAIASVVSLVLIVILGVFTLSFVLNIMSRAFSGSSGIAVFVATLVVAAGVAVAYHLVVGHVTWSRLLRLSRFALANGLSFTADGLVPPYSGTIFGIGTARRVPERLSRTTRPFVDVGNLNYTTGSGKNRKVHHWGYVAIKLERMLPQMILDAKSNNFLGTNLPVRFSRDQVLALEGDFDRYFTLYCPKEYERDALYVFTPDLMARLVDEAAQFDVEIVDDWMFIYSAQPFELTNVATLARVFRIVDTVGDKAVERTERYADDRARGSYSPSGETTLTDRMAGNKVAQAGRRLRPALPVVGVVLLVVVIAVWTLNVLPAIVGR